MWDRVVLPLSQAEGKVLCDTAPLHHLALAPHGLHDTQLPTNESAPPERRLVIARVGMVRMRLHIDVTPRKRLLQLN